VFRAVEELPGEAGDDARRVVRRICGDGSSVGPSELLMLALNKHQCESYVLASGNNSCVLCSPATYWKLLLVLDRPSVLRGSLPYSRSVWYDKMIVDFLSRK
jgi:hypothetical protein